MALVACLHCGQRVSDRAPVCPFCRASLTPAAAPSRIVAAADSRVAPPPQAAVSALAAAAASAPAPAPVAAPAPPRLALAAPYAPGDAIGERYRVLRLLGEGGFGLVYLAVQRSGGAVRAVKTVRDELVRDDRIRTLFRKEAEIWVALGRHPFLVKADAVFEDDGRLFIAMEYVEPPPGGFNSVQGFLERRPPDLTQAVRWAIQACHGMEHAYAQGIRCHRDLKPANLLVGPDNAVRISDFGIAGVIPEAVTAGAAAVAGAGHTVAGTVFGTPTHMPPEQFEGVERCDERSDVYAFGVVLYQLATGGALPFLPAVAAGADAHARFFFELRRLHCDRPPPRLESRLWPIVERCLRKAPAQRYPSFAALRGELETLLAALGGEPVVVPAGAALEASDWASKAASLSGLERLPEALAAYEQALALLPDEPRLHSAKGNLLRRLGRLPEAHAGLDRALALAPERDDTWLNKGLAWSDDGQVDKALECFARATSLNARSNDAWTAQGVMLWRLERHAEALAAFDCALAADARDARAWANKAGLLLEAGRHAEAVACGEKALALDPRNAAYWDGQGTSLFALGRLDEAMRAHDEAVRLDPGFGQGWYNRGNALVQAGRYEDALACFERTCALQPEAAVPWYNRALCLLVLARAPEALTCLRRYLAQAPPTDELRAGAEGLAAGIESGDVTQMALGGGGPRIGSLRSADDGIVDQQAAARGVEEAARQAPAPSGPRTAEIPAAPPGYVHRPGPEVARHPCTADVGVRSHATGELNGRGSELYAAKRYAEALACFEKAISLDRFHARARGNRANALHALGRKEEALAAVREALAIEPGLAVFWHSKAHIELDLGQLAQASASFRDFVALAQGGDFEAQVRDAQARIQKLADRKVQPAPRDGLGWCATGWRHGADGRFRQAVEAFDRALRLEPQRHAWWTARGNALNHEGRWPEAVASYEQAIAIEPGDVGAWHGKAMALARDRRTDEAIAAFDEALRQDPDDAASWADRGRYLGAANRLEESIASIECASLLAPENPAPWFNRALAEEQLGWLPEAARSYRRFLERAHSGQVAQIESARDRIAVLPAPAPDPPVFAALLATVARQAPQPPPPPPAAAAPAAPAASSAILAAAATTGAPPAPARVQAQVARSAGNRARAIDLLQGHLAGMPDDGAAWQELAGDLRELGRLEEALAALDKAQPLVTDVVPILNDRGLILMRLGRVREALLPFQMASLVSDLPAVWTNLGRAHQALGEHAKALLMFDGVRGGGDNPEVQEARAESLRRLSRPDEALAAVEASLALAERAQAWYVKGNVLSDLKRPTDAVAAYDRALALEPAKANAWFNKAHELFFALARPAEALPCCVRAREAHPRFTEAAQLEAQCLAALGRPDEALAADDRALAIEPTHVRALEHKGLLLRKCQRFDEAVACFDAVLAQRAGHLGGLFNKGECLEEAGRVADAAAVFARFLTLAPAGDARVAPLKLRVQALRARLGDAANRPPAAAAVAPQGSPAARAAAAEALKKARFCLGQGQRDKALEWFEACLRADPRDADALTGKGECLFSAGQADEALGCFERALAQRAQHGKLWQMKGACLERLERTDEALEAFERAVACDPQNPMLWDSQGVALLTRGRADEALACFEKALSIEARSPLPKFHLAQAFEVLGRAEDAARAFQQFVSLAPATLQAQVAQARTRLQALRSPR